MQQWRASRSVGLPRNPCVWPVRNERADVFWQSNRALLPVFCSLSDLPLRDAHCFERGRIRDLFLVFALGPAVRPVSNHPDLRRVGCTPVDSLAVRVVAVSANFWCRASVPVIISLTVMMNPHLEFCLHCSQSQKRPVMVLFGCTDV